MTHEDTFTYQRREIARSKSVHSRQCCVECCGEYCSYSFVHGHIQQRITGTIGMIIRRESSLGLICLLMQTYQRHYWNDVFLNCAFPTVTGTVMFNPLTFKQSIMWVTLNNLLLYFTSRSRLVSKMSPECSETNWESAFWSTSKLNPRQLLICIPLWCLKCWEERWARCWLRLLSAYVRRYTATMELILIKSMCMCHAGTKSMKIS